MAKEMDEQAAETFVRRGDDAVGGQADGIGTGDEWNSDKKESKSVFEMRKKKGKKQTQLHEIREELGFNGNVLMF